MATIALNLSDSQSGLADQCRHIEEKLDSNPSFPAPVPSLASLALKRERLTNAIAEGRVGSEAALERRLAYADLRSNMVQLGAYIQSTSGGDEMKILSSGFDVRKRSGRIGVLPAPAELKFIPQPVIGDIMIECKKVYGASSYVIQINTTGNMAGDWSDYTESTRTRIRMSGFDSAKLTWFRMCAVSTAGRGAYSDPVRTVAL